MSIHVEIYDHQHARHDCYDNKRQAIKKKQQQKTQNVAHNVKG